MSIDNLKNSGVNSKNPLLRKIAQLELAATKNMEEAGAEGPLKSGLESRPSTRCSGKPILGPRAMGHGFSSILVFSELSPTDI
jgi:hypothetical protein